MLTQLIILNFNKLIICFIKSILFILVFSLILSIQPSISLYAEIWKQDTYEDFNKGVISNTMILSNAAEEYITLLNNWTNMTPSGDTPSGVWYCSLCYDSSNKKIMLFGGFHNGPTYYSNTFVYDLNLNQWTDMNPSDAPSKRSAYSMCYDSYNKKIILFGGEWSGPDYADTWVYDLSLNKWTNMNPSDHPSARSGHAMCYDSDHKKIILFGGHVGAYNDETWVYDLSLNKWTNMNPSAHPSVRAGHTMCYDSYNKKIVFFGGVNGGGSQRDTWIYDLGLNKWTNMNPPAYPQGIFSHMCYDNHNKKIIHFHAGATWVYEVEKTGYYTSKFHDTGCLPIFNKISWSNISLPSIATQKVWIATSEYSNGAWNFLGHDGTADTYYTNNQTIWTGHNKDRYIKYKIYFSTPDITQQPKLDWVSIEYQLFQVSETPEEKEPSTSYTINDVILVPNPFNPYKCEKDYITFFNAPDDIKITIYNILSDELNELKNPDSEHKIKWYGKDSSGRSLPRGLYTARLEDSKGNMRHIKFVIHR